MVRSAVGGSYLMGKPEEAMRRGGVDSGCDAGFARGGLGQANPQVMREF